MHINEFQPELSIQPSDSWELKNNISEEKQVWEMWNILFKCHEYTHLLRFIAILDGRG